MLYEQGSRIINAVRYGRVWGTDRLVLSDDFVVSNVDLAATIFDLVEADVPTKYVMDGTSWLDEVQSAINGDDTTPEDPCCEMRYIDVKQSRSIVTAAYQYIFRANDEVETAGGVNDLYANTYDQQQLYDLNADPDEQINLIADYESYRDQDADGSLSRTITEFQSLMRDYIDETCPLGPEDAECVKPLYTFCTEIVTATVWAYDVESAEYQFVSDYPDCNFSEYYYRIATRRNVVSMEVCCGDDGATFPGDYTAPSGYSSSLDDSAGPPPLIVIKFDMTSTEIVGVILFVSVIGCFGGMIRKECSRPSVKGITLIKMENIGSEDELGECKFIGNEEERQHLAQ